MKKISLFMASVMSAAIIFSAASANADDVTIKVNGEEIYPEAPAVIVNSRTLVPLRAVTEALGFDVAWDSERRGIILTDGNSLVLTWIDHDHVFKTNGVSLTGSATLDATPAIMSDYTMVPLRAISEVFGANVSWDDGTRTVSVEYEKSNQSVEGLAEQLKNYEIALYEKYDAYAGYVDGTGNKVNAQIQLENGGAIDLELYPDIAPVSVSNFVKLANEHFYDGTIFHRVIKDFMIQGGGFDTSYKQLSAKTITGEFLDNQVLNLIPHEAGVLSMARADDFNSGSSQFFIVHKASNFLDGKYAAFGKVTGGMEYVNEIAQTETAKKENFGDDVPVTEQVIKTVIIK